MLFANFLLSICRFTVAMKKKRLELRLALYTAVHNSISSIDPLADIIKDEFGGASLDLKRTKTSRLIQKILSPYFQQVLRSDLQDALFSIMVDEATDISVTKLLGISIKYFSKSKNDIVSTFLQVVEVTEADAASLTAAVQLVLDKWGLKSKNFVGLGTDGASNMQGVHNSLQANLRQDHPHLVHIWCVCHSLDLAARDATKAALPSNLDYLLRESYNWFAHSSLRQSQYKEIVNLIGVDSLQGEEDLDENGNQVSPRALKLLSPGRTRWLVLACCVERILSQYDALAAHFAIAADRERSFDARQLSSMYQREDTRLFLHFLHPVLQELKNLNLLLQTNSKETFKTFESFRVYFRALGTRILKPAVLSTNNDDELCDLSLESGFCVLEDEDVDFGIKFLDLLQKSKQSSVDKSLIKRRCKAFLLELFKGMQKRLRGTLQLMRKVERWTFPDILSGVGDSFPAPFFPQDSKTISELESSLRKVRQMKWKSQTSVDFWIEVHSYKNPLGQQPFQDLATGALRMAVLPISNAEIERVFSQVTHVKQKRRASMGTDMLESILFCKFGLRRMGKEAGQFIPPNSLLHYDSSIYD